MKKRQYVPKRGDLIWVTLNPRTGHEQAGRRPAVVLSPLPYNKKVGLAILCPVTSRIKGYPFEVAIPPDLPISGVILADQVKNLDWRARRVELISPLPEKSVTEVMQKLGSLLSPGSS